MGDTFVTTRVLQARSRGKRVEWDLRGSSRQEMLNHARERGARAVWFADGSTEELT
jgi:hypothetical protein